MKSDAKVQPKFVGVFVRDFLGSMTRVAISEGWNTGVKVRLCTGMEDKRV